MARTGPPKTAVCVLRVESRGEAGVLITLTTTPDISVITPGHTQSVVRFDDALSLVANFLREYECSENSSNGAS